MRKEARARTSEMSALRLIMGSMKRRPIATASRFKGCVVVMSAVVLTRMVEVADGHSEAEFGMSWCAGFNSSFYEAYHKVSRSPSSTLAGWPCESFYCEGIPRHWQGIVPLKGE